MSVEETDLISDWLDAYAEAQAEAEAEMKRM